MGEFKTKYLYGASVQGIQGFIFQTNKLKEIVGASELVANICTEAFDEYGPREVESEGKKKENVNSIVRAAGNIKYIFDKEEDCRKAVLQFPRMVMNMAPGITISQAVVQFSNEKDFDKAVIELETRLRIQRNKPVRSMSIGLMAIARSRATGLPGICYEKNELIDEGTYKKRKITEDDIKKGVFKLPRKSFGKAVKLSKDNLPFDIDKITGSNNWIAIIHADGNGLGKIIETIGEDKDALSFISKKLDLATEKAANEAYEKVKNNFVEKKMIPIRPIVLSGDDLTLICRADLATPYTKAFLEAFERQTKEHFAKIENNELLKNGLTACAGIAFVKSSYPFHYAVHLAESLCLKAKEEARNKAKEKKLRLAPSCLMFHKVQDSFIEDYDTIIEKDLQPTSTVSFKYGPYYLSVNYGASLIDLLEFKDYLNKGEGKSIKSILREWLELLRDDLGAADQRMKRIIRISSKRVRKNTESVCNKLKLSEYQNLSEIGDLKLIPFYDILSLASIEMENKNKEVES